MKPSRRNGRWGDGGRKVRGEESGRTERWMSATWNRQEFVLLPKDNVISMLVINHIHNISGHLSTASTIARIRAK